MRPVWLSHVLTGGAGVVLGALVVHWWSSTARVDDARAATPVTEGGATIVASSDVSASDERLRRLIREEFARRDAVPVAAPASPAVASTAQAFADSPDVQAKSARANAVLDAATARLVWREEDAAELRQILSGLPPAEREALMIRFAQAVNDRGMRLETLGPPF
jgi:hypothetical protein